MKTSTAVLPATGTVLLSTALLFSYYYAVYNAATLLISIILPVCYAISLLAFGRIKIFAYAYLAYFFSLVDDAPVYFDSVLTWPEVTGGMQHIGLELILHILTLGFMLIALREAIKPISLLERRMILPNLLILIAFLLSYAQNIPLQPISSMVRGQWYLLDMLEHVISLFFFVSSIYVAKYSRSTRV
ncbi:MAG: hypothetical protein QXX17_07470 [Conexivisphaerales archaeon]